MSDDTIRRIKCYEMDVAGSTYRIINDTEVYWLAPNSGEWIRNVIGSGLVIEAYGQRVYGRKAS